MFRMAVVDFMHEWELGVWKALLIHLIRLVTAQGAKAVVDLDFRCALFSWMIRSHHSDRFPIVSVKSPHLVEILYEDFTPMCQG